MSAGAIRYPFERTLPEPGGTIEVRPGVHWIRMPLPFALDHINLWAIEDGDGWTLVDTGYGSDATRELWEQVLAGPLGGRPVRRIVVTHFHPDHVGNADWLSRRTGACVWMTAAEYLSAHAARDDAAGFDRTTSLAFFGRNGLDIAGIPENLRLGNAYRKGVPELPHTFHRMMHGDRLSIGGHDWTVITAFGHAPEHATLHAPSLGLLISGDQVLPRITTNVGVWGNQPDADPLALFLDSLGRFDGLDPAARVLPSHDRVFEGLPERIAQLRAHHEERLAQVLEACARPVTAFEILPVLFKRPLDTHQMAFAMGEAIAHLHRLHADGLVTREEAGGVRRFA
ncbi:MAG TPA: MBL fold metallo-hydrolase, partial [Usitatibacteraceae bacterium]|nr:MBL fold metallo-hydrolase [Usitatibacteraceae bacterium]